MINLLAFCYLLKYSNNRNPNKHGGCRMEKEIITVGDVAALLRLSKTRVRQKAASGELPGKKIPGGRDWFFNKKEIEKILP